MGTANHTDNRPTWQGWQRGSLDTTMVQGEHLWLPVPGFPCSLSGAPCPDAQSSRALPQPLYPSRDKAKWQVVAGKGI